MCKCKILQQCRKATKAYLLVLCILLCMLISKLFDKIKITKITICKIQSAKLLYDSLCPLITFFFFNYPSVQAAFNAKTFW